MGCIRQHIFCKGAHTPLLRPYVSFIGDAFVLRRPGADAAISLFYLTLPSFLIFQNVFCASSHALVILMLFISFQQCNILCHDLSRLFSFFFVKINLTDVTKTVCTYIMFFIKPGYKLLNINCNI